MIPARIDGPAPDAVLGVPVLRYEEVHLSVEGRRFLNGISLSLYEGDVFVLFGPVNCGKSLFSRLATCVIRPETGAIYLEEKEISRSENHQLSLIRRKIGSVMFNSVLISNRTAGENIALPLRYHTMLPEWKIQEKVDLILDFFDASPHKFQRPVHLDSVAKRKVAIARALVLRPRIVFLDEPTANLGFIAANQLQEDIFGFIESDLWHDPDLMNDASRLKGTAVFIATNNPYRYLNFGTRFGMLYEGKLVFEGIEKELREVKNEYVHQYMTGQSAGPVHEY